MKLCTRFLPLSILFIFTTGFTWGSGSEDKCVEAAKLFRRMPPLTSDGKRALQEQQIIDLCPEGAVASLIRGVRLEQSGNMEGASAEYRRAVQLDDSLAVAHGNLGLLLVEKGLTDEAAIELTKGIMSKSDPRYHHGLATILTEGNMYALALFHYSEALKGMPLNSSVLAGMGKAYAGLGQLDKTERIYRDLIQKESDNIPIRMELAEILRKRGNLTDALTELKTVAAARPNDRQAHRLLAEIYKEQGNEEAALKELTLAGINPSSQLEALVQQGDREMAARNYEKAAYAYRKALKAKPGWPEVMTKLGNAEMALGDDDAALSVYREALAHNGLDSESMYNLGTLHERKGQLDEAITIYRQALQANPDNGNVRRRLADIHALRGDFRQAIDQYTMLLKDRPDNPILHLKLSKVFEKDKKFKEAMAEYEEALRLDPENLEGHRELAILYAKHGYPAKAADQYRQILHLKQEDKDSRLALTALYVKMKEYDALTSLLEEGTRLFPEDANSHYRLGIIYEYKKNYPAAIEEYQKTVDLQPSNAKGLNALGRLLLKTGRKKEARATLEAAKRADPGLSEPRMLLSTIREDLSAQPSKKKKSYKKKKKPPTQKKKPGKSRK